MKASLGSRHAKLTARASAIAIACALLAGAAPLASAQGSASPTADGFAPGRILVMPQAGLPEQALQGILRENGAGNAKRIGRSELRAVSVPAGQEQSVVARLSHNPHVKFAELDMRVPEAMVPNDPYFGSAWHLPKIGATTAWDSTQGSGVIIAILDSGIDTKHPDFAGRLVPGYNVIDGNTNVEDVRSHGTKVAGAAAGTTNNGTGVAAVAGAAKIMPIRVADSSGYVYWSDMAAGLRWAADHGARVANMSFNGVASSSSVLSAAQYFKSLGGLVFVSAGNDGVDPGYASTSSMIIVTGTTSADAKASWSNYGDHVHLAAPGSGIYTTNWGQAYSSASGTSVAAPVAAGVAALVMSANPGLSSAQVESTLFKTAVDLGSTGRDIYFGYGRVDAAAAVAAAKSTTAVTTDTSAPSASISAPLEASTVSGLVSVSVSASDNVGVSKVALYVNGALLASDTSSPYTFSWDTRNAANGTATLVAKAYDAAGNIGTSKQVNVYVSNAVTTDTTAPTVSISNPINGSTVGGTIQVSVSASDNAGASALKQYLYIDGKLVTSATGGSLSYSWNTRKVKSGSHGITAKAVDAAGNATSKAVSVTK